MVAIKNILLLASVAVAAVIPRDNAQTLKDLATINADAQKLGSTIKSYDGSLFGALPIYSQSSQTGKDTDTAATNSKGKTFTSSEALDVGNYIISNLEPSIKDALTALVAAKPKFDKIFLTGIVKSQVQDLQKKSAALSKVLTDDTPGDLKTAAQQISDVIAQDFADALAKFK